MKNTPEVRIIFGKFHIMCPFSKALDEVQRSEYKHLGNKDRRYLKGQHYTLLSRCRDLSLDGRRALERQPEMTATGAVSEVFPAD